MGFTEMMLIGIVALVVIGPERLPGVARTAGKYFARLRSFMMNVRADVESELKADELRELFESQQKELQSIKEVVGDVGKDIGLSDIKDEMSDIASSIDDTKPLPGPVPEVKKKSVKRAKSAARPKTTGKPKPRAIPKAKSKPKASARATSASRSPKPKTAKPARVKAK